MSFSVSMSAIIAVIVYQSGGPSYDNRTTEVELVCDGNEAVGRLEFVSEHPIQYRRRDLKEFSDAIRISYGIEFLTNGEFTKKEYLNVLIIEEEVCQVKG